MVLIDTTECPVVAVGIAEQIFCLGHRYRFVIGLVCFLFGSFLIAQSRDTKQVAEPNRTPATQEKAAWIDEKRTDVTRERVRSPVQPAVAASILQGRLESRKQRLNAARIVAGRRPQSHRRQSPVPVYKHKIQPLVFFTSLTGTTKALSEDVIAQLEQLANENNHVCTPVLHDLSYVDLDDFFISSPKMERSSATTKYFYILLLPSYDIDTILTNVLEHFRETHHDFRIDTSPLTGLAGYSVFGVGDKEGWPEHSGFCQQALEVDRWMAKLTGRKRAYPIGLGDVKSDARASLKEWTSGLCRTISEIGVTGVLGDGVPGSGNPVESDDEEIENDEELDFPDNKRAKRQKTERLADLEDVGGQTVTSGSPLAVDFTTYADPNVEPTHKPMVPKSSPTYNALTKQGYTIVGSHSGVKICRWTKSALRGRGSCYKNSFYGIASHLCMETTPSLSCSNKCVFCWRHGTNPVSTTWRWEVDPPELIFAGAKAGHYQKIKMMRGVPGVRAERFEEAMRIKHCALSLVGEPIFYPRINEFLSLLHGERISSFLVCNAQHPQQLRDLHRVTQLYVSIDASNRESLRKVDRPLHRDFWERFQSCLDILHAKRFAQRTVFRLTLVKGFNMSDEAEINGYADLIERARPCFVEVKGVTYCGTSTSSAAGLTMQNVPFYHEVVNFVTRLNDNLAARSFSSAPDFSSFSSTTAAAAAETISADQEIGENEIKDESYGIAAEHAHSCCILLASRRFYLDGKWHTRIDYDRFFELLDREQQTGEPFTPEDYCAPTEEWALWGNGGFDPRDERVDRKGRPKELMK